MKSVYRDVCWNPWHRVRAEMSPQALYNDVGWKLRQEVWEKLKEVRPNIEHQLEMEKYEKEYKEHSVNSTFISRSKEIIGKLL